MLKSSFGVLLYLILRNDISWNLLSNEEKKLIYRANNLHNVKREDYGNPEYYGDRRIRGGQNWENFSDEKKGYCGLILKNILEKHNPIRVLEIGPGPGFYSRLLCEFPTVEHYTAIDINPIFIDYLLPKLENLKFVKKFSYDLICGNFTSINLSTKFDIVVLFSTVHHIPDRRILFSKIHNLLKPGGFVFCFDPSHYLHRITTLLKNCVTKKYLMKKNFSDIQNLSTHHMCTAGEYKKICRQTSFEIEKLFYKLPHRLSKFKHFLLLKALLSIEIVALIRRK